MASLPTGTVTLLFTDIEGSTLILERLGDAYADALAVHRRVLREAFRRHGGVEVDTEGDACFVVFASAAEALAAAHEGQDALERTGEIRVRMGLHTGEPRVHDGEYVGMDVHRAARVAAAGHGGQILLTEATRVLVGGAEFTDLGVHRLKDIGELHLYQVGDTSFAPLKTLGSGNLPAATTSMVGRDAERSALLSLLREERLVTVLGPGGIGKTTLALELGRTLVEDFNDGVWFVDLSPVTDAAQLEQTVSVVVGASAPLAVHLRDRRALLILDNFEQLVAVADRVAALLEAAPRLAILVTSREALRLRRERAFPLQPLAEDASVELFRERAGAVSPSFSADDELLARLCERLDRIPLAIELAAARTRVLDAAQLLERLDARLPLLTGGARDAPERQRTLRSTIEWSHDLLSPGEQHLFARLGVFVGGWMFEAAEHVCGADLDTLQAVAEKSLISSERGRFGILETIREFATERLAASSEADAIRDRHARYFAALAARAGPNLTGPEQRVWLDRIEADYENLRTAFVRFAEDPATRGEAVQLAASLPLFWYVRGRYASGIEWLERAVAMSEGDRSMARGRAVWGLGFLYAIVAEGSRSQPLLEESLAIAREHGDLSMIARSLDLLGILAFFQNDLTRARAIYEEAIGHARAAGDHWCLADCLGTIGSIYPLIGEFDLAIASGTEGLEIARREDDRQGIRMALFGLALAEARLSHLERARAMAEEGLGICREIGDAFFASYFLWILALVDKDTGHLDAARAQADESLRIAEELEVPLLLVCALEASAGISCAHGDLDGAWSLLTRADEIGSSGMVPFSYAATVARRLGELASARGDARTGRTYLERSLAIADSVGDAWGVERSTEAIDAMDVGEVPN